MELMFYSKNYDIDFSYIVSCNLYGENDNFDVSICPDIIYGCTNPIASNYSSEATDDDSSCVFAIGCDTCSGETEGSGTVVENLSLIHIS